MEIKERKLAGSYEVNLQPRIDERGFFMRTYDKNIFEYSQIDRNWVQENHSRSEKSGIIRGLHFQLPPFTETKLVRCIKGAILDVFVDLRWNSSTFGQWDSILLTEENKKMILIPRGFAHGFLTISDISEVVYKVDNYYSQEYERGLIWNDENLKIDWGITEPILSDKDRRNMSFEEFVNEYKGIKV
jgi:dTDP-4-dehydrorhamnose 3,5-epimerase